MKPETRRFLDRCRDGKLNGANGDSLEPLATEVRALLIEAQETVDMYQDLTGAGEDKELHGRLYALKNKAMVIEADCLKARKNIARIRQAMAEMDQAYERLGL